MAGVLFFEDQDGFENAKIEDQNGFENAEIAVHKGCVHNFSTPGKDGYDENVAKISRDAVLNCFKSM